jgi:HAE1 family hydrophobic/amphiphilic exporter-1
VITSVGPEAWWRPGGSHEGEVELTLVPSDQRARALAEVQAAAKKALADVALARLQIRPRSTNVLTRIIRRGQDRLGVEIRGHDIEVTDGLADQLLPIVRETDGVSHAEVSREFGKLERVLHVDRARAAELGLGSAEIASAVEHYVLGRVTTRLREGGDEYDVRVQLADADRRRLDLLPGLPIVTPRGERVALGTLVHIEETRGPASIQRIDQERVLRIDAGTAERPLGEIAADLRSRVASVATPEGYDVLVSGELDEQGKTFYRLLLGILLASFLVYATMAVQFESLRQPLVVMASVPFAFTGVVAALLAWGTPFGMTAFLGALLLVGIVVNNAIVLVDCANQLREEKSLGPREALILAGQRRLRPILMTTLTTVLGLLPLAFTKAEGSEIVRDLGAVGITVEAKEVKDVRAVARKRDHGGLVLMTSTGERNDEPEKYWNIPQVSGQYDRSFRSDAFDDGVVALVEREERALYPERREQIRDLLFAAYSKKLPNRPLFFLADRMVVAPTLDGWEVGSGKNFATTLERWHCNEPAEAE